MKITQQIRRRGCRGFTLTEVLLASSISLMVVAMTTGIFISVFKSWRGIDQRMQADRDVNRAMSRMVYGVGDRRGIRTAATVSIATNTPSGGWTLTYGVDMTVPQTNSIVYSPTAKTLVFNPGSQVLANDLSFASINVQLHSLVVTWRVDRVSGTFRVQREISSQIAWRNWD
jgi:prepilin-type N-terminal cleavage/methylation domain-containing protein